MLSFMSFVALLLAGLVSLVAGQCPNQLAFYNPNSRTFAINTTFFILPVPTAAVEKVVAPKNLITPPASLFNGQLPPGTHPVIFQSGYLDDIRMGPLFIESLMSAFIIVPYIDQLGDGKTPFLNEPLSYVGSTPEQILGGAVPALVATLEGDTTYEGDFTPNDAPFNSLGSNEFTSQVRTEIVPNPVSGPGVEPVAADSTFLTDPTAPIPASTFLTLVNQPLVMNNGMCQRNVYYNNFTFSEPSFYTGNITLYSTFSGEYNGVHGYGACLNDVGFPVQSCQDAAAAGN